MESLVSKLITAHHMHKDWNTVFYYNSQLLQLSSHYINQNQPAGGDLERYGGMPPRGIMFCNIDCASIQSPLSKKNICYAYPICPIIKVFTSMCTYDGSLTFRQASVKLVRVSGSLASY